MSNMRTNQRACRWLIAVLLGIAALSALAVLAVRSSVEPEDLSPGRERAAETSTQPEPVSDPPQEGPARPAGHGLLPGDILEFDFRILRDHRLTHVATGRTRDQHAILSGVLVLSVHERCSSGWIVGVRIDEPDGEHRSAHRTTPTDALRALAGTEVLALMDGSGRFARTTFPETFDLEQRRSLLDILCHWRIVLPADLSANRWETAENDGRGRYRARYERTRENEIVRTKMAYETDDGEPHPARILESRTRFVLDPVLARVEGHERVRLDIPGDRRLDAELTSSFVRRSHARTDGRAGTSRALRRQLLEGKGVTLVEAGSTLTPDEAEAGIRAEVSELNRLLTPGTVLSEECERARRKVIALLRQSPHATEAVLTHLRDPSCGNELARVLISALGAAGTAPAQQGLAEILVAPVSSRARRQAVLFAVLCVSRPEALLDRALRRFRDESPELRGQALLILGAVGGKVRRSDAKRFADIESMIGEQLKARDARSLTVALQALGNLAPERVPEAALRAVDHANPTVRGAAMRSLRKIGDTRAEQILHRSVLRDPHPGVRRLALQSLLERHRFGLAQQPLSDLLADAAKDATKSVRELALRFQKEIRSRS